MRIKFRDESDGVCFARMFDDCTALAPQTVMHGCGTYRCPFYKPSGCKDWIRLERPNYMVLLPPEEVEMRGAEWQ